MSLKKTLLPVLFIFFNSVFANSNSTIELNIYSFNNIDYIDLQEFAQTHNMLLKYYETKDKLELQYEKHKIYFSPSLSYCKIKDNIYHLIYKIILKKNKFYIPLFTFYESMKQAQLPLRIININNDIAYVKSSIYNINKYAISNKQNGSVISLLVSQNFINSNISYSVSSSNWLNITILDGLIDSIAFDDLALQYPISKMKTVQSEQSVQISFLLENNIEDIDIEITNETINFLLRHKIADNAKRINELRKKWFIDTIVIDAGHGGKDPGAIGINKLKEKDVTLDIAKKLGSLIERNLGLNVIYTRDEDIFVPLWKRTKIANKVEGKLFISIHANSTVKGSSIYGFETFLLRVGKTDKAIEVVELENGVIELEENPNQYKEIHENFILASMAQNSFMKESEDFASLIQYNMNKNLSKYSKDRGVKQAGFHVLVGASMPNVLVEVGFLSNKKEANNLSKSFYRRKIAESIYEAILDFKVKYEKPLLYDK